MTSRLPPRPWGFAMSDTKRQFIADCLGLPPHSPRMDQIMVILEMEDRDQRIYGLSGKVPAQDIAVRFDITERRVEQITKERLIMRRSG